MKSDLNAAVFREGAIQLNVRKFGHALAHLRRRDHWVRYLELAATCAYWWHPAAWWARAALREAVDRWRDAAWRAAEGVVVEA